MGKRKRGKGPAGAPAKVAKLSDEAVVEDSDDELPDAESEDVAETDEDVDEGVVEADSADTEDDSNTFYGKPQLRDPKAPLRFEDTEASLIVDQETLEGPDRSGTLYRAPTGEELRALRETDELFKSNLFKLQIQELLTEVRVDYAKTAAITSALHALKSTLEAVKPQHVTVPSKQFPEITLRGGGELALDFVPPANVAVVGSFMLNTVAKPLLNVDVTVEIPKECLQEKDFINHRYTNKRHVYLRVLARSLAKNSRFSSVKFTYFHDDENKPILELRPAPDTSSGQLVKTKFIIRVFPSIAVGVFPVRKLGPDRNNIRRALPDAAGTESNQSATPQYNSSILEDMYMAEHLEVLHSVLNADAAFGKALVDAVLLLKTWLRQRGHSGRGDGVGGFLATMFVGHLVGTRAVNRHMSAYQIFRAVIEFMAKADLREGVVFATGGPTSAEAAAALPTFRAAFDVVFIDAHGVLNLAARVSADAYAELQHDARISLTLLFDALVDGFEQLFIQPLAFFRRYDTYICFPSLPDASLFAHDTTEGLRDWGFVRYVERQIVAVMTRALGARATLVRLIRPQSPTWGVNETAPMLNATVRWACLVLDPSHALRVVDMGPAAEHAEEVAAFKAFWGEKAELRRFQDGAINQAVVWEREGDARARIVRDVCEYVLARQLHMTPRTDVVSLPGNIESVLKTRAGIDLGPCMGAAVRALDELRRTMRELTDVPLSINDLQGVDAAFRYSAVFPPYPHLLAGAGADELDAFGSERSLYVAPLEVVLEFEKSGQWPDDVDAIQRVKTAFLIRVGERLRAQAKIAAVPQREYLDVMMKGFVFRIRVFHDREIALLERDSTTHEVARKLRRDLVARRLHSSTLHAFHLQHIAFGPTVRLAKRWLHSHLFSGVFTDEAVELLVASLFAAPAPYAEPHAPLTGFLRFLHLLATHDFDGQPVVVDTQGSMTAEKINDLRGAFRAVRDAQSGPAVFIATPTDTASSLWTAEGPEPIMLQRMVELAKRSLAALETAMEAASQGKKLDLAGVFHPELEAYDVVIRLEAAALPRHYQALPTRIGAGAEEEPARPQRWLRMKAFKNLPDKAEKLLVGFDPVDAYLNELQSRFGHMGLFLHDELGGDVVCIKWRPQSFAPSSWRTNAANATMPASSEEPKGRKKVPLVVPNVPEILADLQSLGHDLVRSVDEQHSVMPEHASPMAATEAALTVETRRTANGLSRPKVRGSRRKRPASDSSSADARTSDGKPVMQKAGATGAGTSNRAQKRRAAAAAAVGSVPDNLVSQPPRKRLKK